MGHVVNYVTFNHSVATDSARHTQRYRQTYAETDKEGDADKWMSEQPGYELVGGCHVASLCQLYRLPMYTQTQTRLFSSCRSRNNVRSLGFILISISISFT